MLYSNHQENLTDVPLKLKRNGKRLYSANSVKYLGIKMDENLDWKQQISDIAIKINGGNAILSELLYFIDSETLKSVYHAIFEPHFCYASRIWVQNFNSIKIICFAKGLIKVTLYNFEVVMSYIFVS